MSYIPNFHRDRLFPNEDLLSAPTISHLLQRPKVAFKKDSWIFKMLDQLDFHNHSSVAKYVLKAQDNCITVRRSFQPRSTTTCVPKSVSRLSFLILLSAPHATIEWYLSNTCHFLGVIINYFCEQEPVGPLSRFLWTVFRVAVISCIFVYCFSVDESNPVFSSWCAPLAFVKAIGRDLVHSIIHFTFLFLRNSIDMCFLFSFRRWVPLTQQTKYQSTNCLLNSWISWSSRWKVSLCFSKSLQPVLRYPYSFLLGYSLYFTTVLMYSF